MSTHARINFVGDGKVFSLYQQFDGYPDGAMGVLSAIKETKDNAWSVHRFDPSEFCCAYIRGNKIGPGLIRIIHENDAFDVDYTYTVACIAGKIAVSYHEFFDGDNVEKAVLL